MQEKRCSDCKTYKPLDAFPKNRSRKDGLHNTCKECSRIRKKNSYDNDPEKWRKISRDWTDKNSEKKKENDKAYYQANKETIKARSANWRANNGSKPEVRKRKNETRNRWRKNNPERVRAEKLKRRAIGEVPAKLIREMYENQEGRCAYCGITVFDKYEVDHIHPVFLGGDNSPDNLCIACKKCNRSKGHKPLEYWMKVRGW